MHVFTPKEILTAIETNKDGVLTLTKKETAKQFKGGVKYIDVKIHTDKFKNNDPWFSFGDQELVISRGLPNPNDATDARNQQKNESSNSVSLGVRECDSGDVGKMLVALEEVWIPKLPGASVPAAMKVVPWVSRVYGPLHKKAGEVNPFPVINFKISFDRHPANHPVAIFRGKPQTTVFDYDKPYIEDGKTRYHPATVMENGKEVPLTKENAHLFIIDNSIIKGGRFRISSCMSSQGVSAPKDIISVIIQKGKPLAFDDDLDECSAAPPGGAPAPAAENVTEEAVPETVPEVTPDELDLLLDEI